MAKTTKDAPEGPPVGDLAFEAALDELENLVHRMESGELTLEESLAAFERGVKLTRHCQTALKSAELKVKVLTENDSTEFEAADLEGEPDNVDELYDD